MHLVVDGISKKILGVRLWWVLFKQRRAFSFIWPYEVVIFCLFFNVVLAAQLDEIFEAEHRGQHLQGVCMQFHGVPVSTEEL